MRRLAVLLTILLCACSAASTSRSTTTTTTTVPSGPRHSVTGVLGIIHDAELEPDGSPCASDRYPDIVPGVRVVVSDESGTELGSGALSAGHALPPYECDFTFVIANVGDAASIYNFTIANHGKYSLTHALMDRAGWRVSVQLSNDSSGLVALGS